MEALRRDIRGTRFVSLLVAIAGEALRCLDPDATFPRGNPCRFSGNSLRADGGIPWPGRAGLPLISRRGIRNKSEIEAF